MVYSNHSERGVFGPRTQARHVLALGCQLIVRCGATFVRLEIVKVLIKKSLTISTRCRLSLARSLLLVYYSLTPSVSFDEENLDLSPYKVVRCSSAVFLLAAVAACTQSQTAASGKKIHHGNHTSKVTSVRRHNTIADVDAAIDPRITGAERRVIRNVMLHLPPMARGNVIYIENGRAYANRPELTREIEFLKPVKGMPNVYMRADGTMIPGPP